MVLLESELPHGLRSIVRALVRIKTVIVVFSLPILPITFFLVVLFRYVLETDLFAYEEWLLPICFWLYFLGGALGTYDDVHINADLLGAVSDSPKYLWLRKIAITIIELVIVLFVVYWAYLMLADEIASYPGWKTTIALKIPFFIPRVGIFLGFVFMAFYSALFLYLLWKVGPDQYVETISQANKAKEIEEERATW
ncbi:MAG: TRAP transporter small permease subunit [Gammaproteobacteria bacterium]|jgi:TRAP-type C4-dicarboxylate transport system permease small subunit|nr:TRAP transporter small permease subunit [Gammaproteobacteria bacterium]